MGQYNSGVITSAGQQLITQAIAGDGVISFPYMKTSSWAIPAGTNIPALTDLQNIEQTVTPGDAQIFNGTMIQVSALFSNSNKGAEITEAYLVQTVGLWAQITGGQPTLFAVYQATTPDQMPAYNNVAPSSLIYALQATVQQASQLTVQVNPAGAATAQDIANLRTEIQQTYIPVSLLGQPNGVASLDSTGKMPALQLPAVIDCGVWNGSTANSVSVHNATAMAHQALIVDGNNVNGVDASQTLEEHMVNPYAHQNLIVDGNNT